MAPVKIGIVGAGPAGLTLASILTASGKDYDFTIFDQGSRPDPSEVNGPSDNLDMQDGSSMDAIKAAKLFEKLEKVPSASTKQTIINEKDLTCLVDKSRPGRPEIPRSALIQLLLSSIPADRFKWRTKVVKVAGTGADGKSTIEYQSASGSTSSEKFDLLVGADGPWSLVRRAIPGAPEPVYCGAMYLKLDIQNVPKHDPKINEIIGRGVWGACGDNKVLLSQRGVHDSSRLYFFMHSKTQAAYAKTLPEWDDSKGPNPALDPKPFLDSLPKNHADLEKFLLENPDFFDDWHPDVKKVISIGCRDQPAGAPVEAAGLYMMPLEKFPHPHAKGIALIGDSGHLMAPMADQGVNVAMFDALSLAKQLDTLSASPSPEQVDEAVVAFEEVAHPNAQNAMGMTWGSVGLSYDPAGPSKLVSIMSAHW